METSDLNETAGELRDRLQQLRTLTDCLPPAVFSGDADDGIGSHSPGRHIRHVADHCRAILNADDGLVDYESRRRDSELERSPARARRELDALIADLDRWEARHGPEEGVVVQWYRGDGRPARARSTCLRELQFVCSHAVHHMSLLRMLLEQNDMEFPADFGLATSTRLFHYGTKPAGSGAA